MDVTQVNQKVWSLNKKPHSFQMSKYLPERTLQNKTILKNLHPKWMMNWVNKHRANINNSNGISYENMIKEKLNR